MRYASSTSFKLALNGGLKLAVTRVRLKRVGAM
jgi:hypothetical protein